MKRRCVTGWLAAALSLGMWGAASLGAEGGKPDFSRQIQPILAGRCYKCHGPDDKVREGGLRLDVREGAIHELEGGGRAVVPGNPGESELLRRVTSTDPDERMPPPKEGEGLTAKEVELVKQWIESGAEYAAHWSYVVPKRPRLPEVRYGGWVRNGIDAFVLERLEREGIGPSMEADRSTLIRRVSLDLVGLPPTPGEVDAFLRDESGDAYERVVERLLASPEFGERWGRVWLDLARYADSAGYADDPPRIIWKYRDWVIGAMNANLPFDEFTIQQIAGDMLAKPGNEELIATAFHRNTMTNSEGGTDDEEFRNVAIVDRVNTTMQVWMATTMMCAQCHTHKYDPFTQKEYFQLFAMLNQTEDSDKRDESPTLDLFTEEQLTQQQELKERLAELEREREEKLKSDDPMLKLPTGELKGRYLRIELSGAKKILSLAEVQAFAGEMNLAAMGKATQSSTDFGGEASRAIDGNPDGHYTNANSTTHTKESDDPWWEVDLGKSAVIDRVVIWNRTDAAGIGDRLNGFRLILLDEQRMPLWAKIVEKAAEKEGNLAAPKSGEEIAEGDREETLRLRRVAAPEILKVQQKIEETKKGLAGIKAVPTPIQRELAADKQRKTRIQIRGNFLDLADEVSAGYPVSLHGSPAGEGLNRMGLAKWLVSGRNPLTARVIANRHWEQIFGIGLVETSEDFGLKGELPSHPQLLDWLACELMNPIQPGEDVSSRAGAWDIKNLLRMIVTSATYRQVSETTDERVAADPNNRLLSRGPRHRLSAETVRDQALNVAGLLSKKMNGPSVYPPRPVLGLTAAFGASMDWQTSPGEDRWRRGLYTYWQRSIPYPSMDAFDAPSREVCTIRRSRTNTPLQALVTLNDPVYVEAAQGLARRMIREVPGSVGERITYGFRLCVSRVPTESELQVLTRTFEQAKAMYAGQPEEAKRMASDPLGPVPEGWDVAETAAWTVVSNVLLNLDEFVARR